MHRIMIIDDDVTNLSIAKINLEKNYDVMPVLSGEKALKLLEQRKILPDLILLDINMPGMNGFEFIIKLKNSQRFSDIPVIFLTSQSDSFNEAKGLSLGAVDYIHKPFEPLLLLKRINLHIHILEQSKQLERYNNNLQEMINEKTKSIEELQHTILTTVADLINKRDGFTGTHINQVSCYIKVLLNAIIKRGLGRDIPQHDIDMISMCAKLHDVGKIAISDSILLKKGKLTDQEMNEMKKHTIYGAEAIKKSMSMTKENTFLKYALKMARSHHERWDGTGYPDMLKGEEISYIARILSVADVYDAITSERSYKSAKSHEEAVNIISEGSGTQFDPKIINVFLNIQDEFLKVKNSFFNNN